MIHNKMKRGCISQIKQHQNVKIESMDTVLLITNLNVHSFNLKKINYTPKVLVCITMNLFRGINQRMLDDHWLAEALFYIRSFMIPSNIG